MLEVTFFSLLSFGLPWQCCVDVCTVHAPRTVYKVQCSIGMAPYYFLMVNVKSRLWQINACEAVALPWTVCVCVSVFPRHPCHVRTQQGRCGYFFRCVSSKTYERTHGFPCCCPVKVCCGHAATGLPILERPRDCSPTWVMLRRHHASVLLRSGARPEMMILFECTT